MTESVAAASTGRAWTSVVLAWIFPGLGHYYLGRRRRALFYAAVITLTFLFGLSFQGRLYSPESGAPLTLLASFAVFGSGLLNILARLLLDNPRGAILAVTYEYGCVFLLTAGLMNLLLTLDAYDIAVGRKP